MALVPYRGFVGPSYTPQSKIAAYDRTVNWYCERIESGTGNNDARYVLYPTPGYNTIAVMPTAPGRAIFELNGVTYTIGGTALYTISITGETVLRAQGLATSSVPIYIPAQILGNGDAGHQLLFRSARTLYTLDLNAPISEDVPLDPPAEILLPSGTGNYSAGPPGLAFGYFGYAYTWVTATGETTPSPRIPLFNPGVGQPFGGGMHLSAIAAGASVVTSRNIYRTEAQATIPDANTAQLKLVGTITGNTVTVFDDEHPDADLGVNAPTANTATVHIEALTVIDVESDQIAYLDGYGLSLDRSRSEVRFSGLFDFTTWDALDVWQRSDAADRWQAMVVNHKEIWLFGVETTSVYYHSGDADTPFQPISSVFIPAGIVAPLSACVVDGSVMWVGKGNNGLGVVYRANGYTPERVSTHAVEFALSTMPGLIYAEGYTYQEHGHVFYELTFPTLGEDLPGITWVYDATAGLWHERGVWDGTQFLEIDTRGHIIDISSRHVTISRTNGAVYHQSASLFSVGTDGLGIKRLRRAPHINQAQRRTRFSHLRLLMETGLGLGNVPATNPGFDPQITLSWSDDGGQTFGSSYTVSAGKIGQYSTLVDWWQLGQGRDRIFEVTCSAPVPWRIVDAFLDYTVGAS